MYKVSMLIFTVLNIAIFCLLNEFFYKKLAMVLLLSDVIWITMLFPTRREKTDSEESIISKNLVSYSAVGLILISPVLILLPKFNLWININSNSAHYVSSFKLVNLITISFLMSSVFFMKAKLREDK